MQDLCAPLVGTEDNPVRRSTNVSFHDASSPMNSDAILRKGKWTTEEEEYANKIISLFNRGLLPIGAGTTLRSYLSDKLHCDPMRITKKFAGASCIGKQVFQPSESLTGDRCEEIQELEVLETLFYHRVGDRSAGVHRQSPDDDADSSTGQTQSKPISVKWNREEGDTDVSSAKHRAEFVGKVKEKSSRPSSSGLGMIGMRSVVSAPDFSELKMLHASAERNIEERKRGIQSSNFYGKQRSQSVTDFMDFEHYISDDSAAGDLLMQFASKITGTQSDDENNSDEILGESAGPVTKFISSSTIGKNSSSSRSGKLPGMRNDSLGYFDRSSQSMDAISICEEPSRKSSGSGTAAVEGKQEDHGDEEGPPIMVDQSSSLTGHAYEEEDTYDFYESQPQSSKHSAHGSSAPPLSSAQIRPNDGPPNEDLRTTSKVKEEPRPCVHSGTDEQGRGELENISKSQPPYITTNTGEIFPLASVPFPALVPVSADLHSAPAITPPTESTPVNSCIGEIVGSDK